MINFNVEGLSALAVYSIHAQLPSIYGSIFLRQPEDVECCGDRDTFITLVRMSAGCTAHSSAQL
jgi:hypothetical protein